MACQCLWRHRECMQPMHPPSKLRVRGGGGAEKGGSDQVCPMLDVQHAGEAVVRCTCMRRGVACVCIWDVLHRMCHVSSWHQGEAFRVIACATVRAEQSTSPCKMHILQTMAVNLLLCVQVGQVSAEHPELCERCLPVVDALGFKLPGTAAAAPAPAAEKAAAAV
jgi:hypothetical protein